MAEPEVLDSAELRYRVNYRMTNRKFAILRSIGGYFMGRHVGKVRLFPDNSTIRIVVYLDPRNRESVMWDYDFIISYDGLIYQVLFKEDEIVQIKAWINFYNFKQDMDKEHMLSASAPC